MDDTSMDNKAASDPEMALAAHKITPGKTITR